MLQMLQVLQMLQKSMMCTSYLRAGSQAPAGEGRRFVGLPHVIEDREDLRVLYCRCCRCCG